MPHINQSYLLTRQSLWKRPATQRQGYASACHAVTEDVLLGIQTLIYISNSLLSRGAERCGRGAELHPSPPRHIYIPHLRHLKEYVPVSPARVVVLLSFYKHFSWVKC